MKHMFLSHQTHGEIIDGHKPDHLSSCFESRVAHLAISNTVLSDLFFDPVISLLGVYSTEILPHMHIDICSLQHCV